MSYSVLRRRIPADTWWSAARLRRDAPTPLKTLLAGRSRVEVTNEEAAAALEWAETVDGWSVADPKPLFVHHVGDD